MPKPHPEESATTLSPWLVNLHGKWFWLKFREGGRSVLVRPTGCTFCADAVAASGVLVTGTVIVHPDLPCEPGVDPRRDQAAATFTKVEPEPLTVQVHTSWTQAPTAAPGTGQD